MKVSNFPKSQVGIKYTCCGYMTKFWTGEKICDRGDRKTFFSPSFFPSL